MTNALELIGVSKVYHNGGQELKALDDVSLTINPGEIFALLGPNGAGKTTLIGTICSLVQLTSGQIKVYGFDHVRESYQARECIGLVPQELTLDIFETVWNAVNFSRGLFGKPPNSKFVEEVIKVLGLWPKRDARMRELSGGMRRRVMIAKALSHEPRILFLDEPSAGIDVEQRQAMWDVVRSLQDRGVTIILTTHYIEEAENLADRVGFINHGRLLITEEKTKLLQSLGKKQLIFTLKTPLDHLPEQLAKLNMQLTENGRQICYNFSQDMGDNGIRDLLSAVVASKLDLIDVTSEQSSLEKIFVDLLGAKA